MVYPFPGMNPYLEDPALWPGVHGRLVVAIADALSPQLPPKYIVDISENSQNCFVTSLQGAFSNIADS